MSFSLKGALAAEDAALLGTCARLAVGAAMLRGDYVLASGWNGGPLPCLHINDEPCKDATHAEIRLIGAAARGGIMTQGADLYVTHSPCRSCAQAILQCDFRFVYWASMYRDPAGAVLLAKAGKAAL